MAKMKIDLDVFKNLPEMDEKNEELREEEKNTDDSPAYFGQDILADMPAIKQIIQDLPLLSPEEERELLLRKDDPKAREQLVLRNLRLVINVAKRFRHKSDATFWDLFQIGVEGLFTAIKQYDPDHDTRLSTLAVKIINSNLDEQTRKYQAFKISEYMTTLLKELNRSRKKLLAKLDREPTDMELAAELKISEEELLYRKEIENRIKTTSLFTEIKGKDNLTLADLIEDDDMSLDEQLIHLNQVQEVHKALTQLSPRQKQVVLFHYGFSQEDCMSQEKIAKRMGVSRQRIQQINQDALKKLRKYYGQ